MLRLFLVLPVPTGTRREQPYGLEHTGHLRTRHGGPAAAEAAARRRPPVQPDREPDAAYNRVLFSSVLAGDATLDQIRLKEDEWFDAAGIERYYGAPVTGIDRDNRQVETAGGQSFVYGTLVLATGARPAPRVSRARTWTVC